MKFPCIVPSLDELYIAPPVEYPLFVTEILLIKSPFILFIVAIFSLLFVELFFAGSDLAL